MSIAEKLRILRENQNWSQETLSKMMNIHRSTISRYETGKSIPDDETLREFAKVFNVGQDFFAERHNKTGDEPIPSGFLAKDPPADPDLTIILQLLRDYPNLKKTLISFHLLPPKRKAFAVDALSDFIQLLSHKHKGKI